MCINLVHIKQFTMLIISSREFRANQKNYLDQVDAGQELLVQRGKNKSYRIIPVAESDTVISEEFVLQPDAELARAVTAGELLGGVKADIREIFKTGR